MDLINAVKDALSRKDDEFTYDDISTYATMFWSGSEGLPAANWRIDGNFCYTTFFENFIPNQYLVWTPFFAGSDIEIQIGTDQIQTIRIENAGSDIIIIPANQSVTVSSLTLGNWQMIADTGFKWATVTAK